MSRSKYETNYYIDEYGKKHAIAPSLVPDEVKAKPNAKPNSAKPKPAKPSTPKVDYSAILNAYAHSSEIRKQEAKAQTDEENRLLMQLYNAAKERKKSEFDASMIAQNTHSDELLRNDYVQSELKRRDLPQQQAAMGLSGGASLSGEMALEKQYQKARKEKETQRQGVLDSLLNEFNAYEDKANKSLEGERKKLRGEYEKKLNAIEAELNKQRMAILKKMK
ncbi:MAG: hypothetical protein RR978_09400 [Oscillospiraceae bacterium]